MNSPSSYSPEALREAILLRIRPLPEPSFLYVSDFQDLEPDPCLVSHALCFLSDKGAILHLTKGVFCKPLRRTFGPVWPSLEALVSSYARHCGFQYAAIGATAAYRFGFITERPPVSTYATDGGDRRLIYRDHPIRFMPRGDRFFSYKTKLARSVVPALQYVGVRSLTRQQILDIRQRVFDQDDIQREAFRADVKRMPIPIKRFFQKF